MPLYHIDHRSRWLVLMSRNRRTALFWARAEFGARPCDLRVTPSTKAQADEYIHLTGEIVCDEFSYPLGPPASTTTVPSTPTL